MTKPTVSDFLASLTHAERQEFHVRGRERDEDEDAPDVPLSPELHRKFEAFVVEHLGTIPGLSAA